MSNDNDTVRVYFPATIPKSHLPALAALMTGRDDDVLLDMEEAVNRRLDQVLPDLDFVYKVELDIPITIDFVLREDVTLVTDLVDA